MTNEKNKRTWLDSLFSPEPEADSGKDKPEEVILQPALRQLGVAQCPICKHEVAVFLTKTNRPFINCGFCSARIFYNGPRVDPTAETQHDGGRRMKTAALYARVSTLDQNCEVQLQDLRRFAGQRFTLYREYIDIGVSGAQRHRPQLDILKKDARKRLFDVVLVWKFDRFARSLKHLIESLDEFSALGIDFVSYTEGVDTTTPTGQLLFHIVGAVPNSSATSSPNESARAWHTPGPWESTSGGRAHRWTWKRRQFAFAGQVSSSDRHNLGYPRIASTSRTRPRWEMNEELDHSHHSEFEPLLDTEQAAKLLGNIHVKTLQRYARQGLLPGYRVGGHWYFRASELDAWLGSRINSSGHPCRRTEEAS